MGPSSGVQPNTEFASKCWCKSLSYKKREAREERRTWIRANHSLQHHLVFFPLCPFVFNMNNGLIETLLSNLARHWVLVLVSLVLGWLVKNRYHHGLNKYPGPFLASLTDWWRFVDVYGQRPEVTLQALHAKHGDIVRIGPNTLSFADPAVLKSIYGLNKGYIKVHAPFALVMNCTLIHNSLTFTSSNNPSSKATVLHPSSAPPTMISTPNSAEASIRPFP